MTWRPINHSINTSIFEKEQGVLPEFKDNRNQASAKKQDGAELGWVIVSTRYRRGPSANAETFWGGLKKRVATTFEAPVKISVVL